MFHVHYVSVHAFENFSSVPLGFPSGFVVQKYEVCKDQELKRSEPKPSPQNQNGKYLILQIVKIKERAYGQPSEQLFPIRWPLSNRNRTKII